MGIVLFVANEGFFYDGDVTKVVAFEAALLDYFNQSIRHCVTRANQSGDYNDDNVAKLKACVESFKSSRTYGQAGQGHNMAVGKEIRTQIGSIVQPEDYEAMQLVAASKMRKAQERMGANRPYADRILEVIGHLAYANPEYNHLYR